MQSISRNKQKSQQSTSTIILKVVGISVKDPRITGQTYAKIIDLHNQNDFMESPVFHVKLDQPWLIKLSHTSVYQLQVYSKIKNKFQFLGSETIDQLHGCLEYFYEDKPICVWSAQYEFIDLKQQQQKKTENNQNVFAEQSFFIDEEISRIKEPNKNQISMEKIGYHHMQQTMMHHQNNNNAKNQLVDQLEFLNKSLMQSFKQYTIQKKLCTNLVEETDNLTKSIIEENKDDDQQNYIEPAAILEENDEEVEGGESTQENWFKTKFRNQQLKKKFKKRRYLLDSVKQNNKQVKLVPHIFSSFNDCHQYRLLHSLYFQDDIKPTQILISAQRKGQEPHKIASLTIENGTLKRWEVNISIPMKNAILLQVQEKQGILYGCIGQEEQALGYCSLYSERGQFRGNVHLKIKKIENINIQTQEQLQQMLQTSEIQQANKQQNQKEVNSEENKSLIKQQGIETNNTNEIKKPQKIDPYIPQILYPTPNEANNSEEQIHHPPLDIKNATKNSPMKKFPNTLKFDDLDHTGHNSEQKIMTKHVRSCRLNYDTPTNISNNSAQSNQSLAINRGSLNFKIQSITIQLKKPIYHEKYLKIWMQGYQPYLTEISNQSSLPFWKGRGYLFQKISRFTILHIEMYRILKDEYIKFQGNCRIYLTELPPEKLEKLNSTYYLMLDKNKEILGNLYIEYKFIDKKNAHQSSRKFKQIHNAPKSFQVQTPTQQSAIRATKKRMKTDPNQETNDQHCLFRSNIRQRRLCCSLHKISYFNGSTPRGSKGGNIVIPKAKKFPSINNRERGDPGPGTYHISSHFDRYKSTDI